MNDKKDKTTSEAEAELQREIRAGRKFTLSEAIGRMAGPGAMKGVSPMSNKQQAENIIAETLRSYLSDTSCALRTVLLRRLANSEQLLHNYDHPLKFLAEWLRRVLASEERLKDVVMETDIEWGHINSERPYFEKEGSAPHADDPYTFESVKKTLSKLLEMLDT
jgi:hypothetical protein